MLGAKGKSERGDLGVGGKTTFVSGRRFRFDMRPADGLIGLSSPGINSTNTLLSISFFM